jgi:hypothetical protein
VLIEASIILICVFLVINLLLSWINLNLAFEIREGLIVFAESLPKTSGNPETVLRKINDIENFLREMTDAMGNPFQMLAATHGSRIIEHFFPPKIEPLEQQRGDGSLNAELPSPATWQDVEQNLNAEEVDQEA